MPIQAAIVILGLFICKIIRHTDKNGQNDNFFSHKWTVNLRIKDSRFKMNNNNKMKMKTKCLKVMFELQLRLGAIQKIRDTPGGGGGPKSVK